MDISARVERIRTHRFDGYTPNGIADEIDKFRSGSGVSGIGEAVEALKSVARELRTTDDTLRAELAKLGVDWESKAGTDAGAVLGQQAGFSGQAGDKVSLSAELIFAQGEAFSRALHQLPDSGTVRAGAQDFTLGDGLMSLIGFETDHAKAVKDAREAKDQAVGVLNQYAQDSGNNLSLTEQIGRPDLLNMANAPSGPGGIPDVGGQVPNPTQAASAATDFTPGGSGPRTSPAGAGGYDPPTPPMGLPAPGGPHDRPSGGARPPIPDSSTSPSGSAPPVVGPAPGGSRPSRPGQLPGQSYPGGQHPSGQHPGGQQPGLPPNQPGPGGQPAPGKSGPGGSTSTGVPGGGPTANTGGLAGRLGGGADNLVGGKGATGGGLGGLPGGGNAGDGAMAKGKVFGAGPQAPASAPNNFGGYNAVPRPGGVGDFASGAAAMGAGAVGGAMAGGEGDRRGRGVGRSGGATPPRSGQVPMGDLPEEEARALRRTGKESEENKRRGLLSQAAPQDGEDDAEHVRKFGIDDKDLFTDQRMVAPDVIGVEDAGGTR